jgi:hypothetical protein
MAQKRSIQERIVLDCLAGGRLARSRDLVQAGASRTAIARLLAEGRITQAARGFYRLADAEFEMYETWAALARKAPDAIVCLRSAAMFHMMTQDFVGELCVAVPHEKGSRPSLGDMAMVEVVRWRAGDAFEVGVEEHEILGVPVRITNPARTLVDLFRYSTLNPRVQQAARSIITETFLDALFRYLDPSRRIADINELVRIATTFKVLDLMTPYLQTATFSFSYGQPVDTRPEEAHVAR